MSARASAFTLIELLAVVAVVSILLALLFPQVGRMTEAANRSKCNGKLKAIGAAFITYAADNGGVIPCVMVEGNGGTNPSRGNWLMELSAYVNPDGEITSNNEMHNYSVCPTYLAKFGKQTSWTDWKGGYGMNYRLFRPSGDNSDLSKKERVRLASLPSPSQNILAADCGPSVGLETNADGTFVPDAGSWTGHVGAHPNRHGASANYLFADGHTESLSPADATAALRIRTP
jgi:prepilin-type processing-associated H-X9-DG protein/prepilin-type N-terminal cleavage/methylation domain-containing protein